MSIIYAFDEVKTLESMTEIERDILRRVEILFESDVLEEKEEVDLIYVAGKYSLGFIDARSIGGTLEHYEEKLAESKGEK